MKYERPKLRFENWEEEEEVFTDGVHVSLQPDGEGDFDGDDVPEGWW